MEGNLSMTGQSVSQGIREGLLEPFIVATGLTLREWIGIEATPQIISRHERLWPLADVSVLLRLCTAEEGVLILSFPAQTAAALAARALAEVTSEPSPDLIPDCVGEVGNVIVGHAKALLHDTPYRFTFSTPILLSGPQPALELPRAGDYLIVVFNSDVGSFSLQLCLRPRTEPAAQV